MHTGIWLTITVVRGGQAVGTSVRCVSSTVVQCDVVNIKPSAVGNSEAMDRVILDVNIVNRTGSKNFGELNEMVGPESFVSTC